MEDETTQTLPTPTETAEAEPTSNGAVPAEPTADAETQPEAEEQPAWATITDPYDLLDHEAVKPHLERRDRRVEQDLRTQYDNEFAGFKRSWESEQVHQKLAGYVGNILEKIEGGEIDATERLLGKVEALVAPYSEDYRKSLQAEGSRGASATFLDALKTSLNRRERDEFDDIVANGRNLTWEGALDEWSKLKFGEQEKNLKAEIKKRDDTIEKLKAEGRTGQGPNLAQSAPGSGKSDRELLADPTTPVEKLMEIRARQRSGQ